MKSRVQKQHDNTEKHMLILLLQRGSHRMVKKPFTRRKTSGAVEDQHLRGQTGSSQDCYKKYHPVFGRSTEESNRRFALSCSNRMNVKIPSEGARTHAHTHTLGTLHTKARVEVPPEAQRHEHIGHDTRSRGPRLSMPHEVAGDAFVYFGFPPTTTGYMCMYSYNV